MPRIVTALALAVALAAAAAQLRRRGPTEECG